MMAEHGQEQLAQAFERERPYLRRIAYGTLGSFAEADDVVQEAWLRLQRVDPGEISDLRAWLTTAVGRLALDALGSARSRRERYVGPWLPEPMIEGIGASGVGWATSTEAAVRLGQDPADRVTTDERVTTALLVVLERLSPAERTAFVLHDVFGLPFDEVAEVVGRSPAAVRQLAARARRHVEAGTPRFPASPDEHAQIVVAFAAAWQAGDVERLLAVLDPDVVMTSDGGGRVMAARKPLHGADRVVQTLLAFERYHRERGFEMRGALETVNGLPGMLLYDGEILSVFSCTIDAGRIVALDVVRNPDKLRHVPPPGAGGSTTAPEA
jgi:RNA polymerase sigma factor (sigma-70 family)